MSTMTATSASEFRTGGMTAEERKVIFASSLGTVFEWYDFYIYGTLGAFLAKYFFSNVPPNVGFIFALLAFAAGFAVRPFGALIFGRIGDMIGRKYTFLVTMTLMGIGTFFIGVLPGYESWGLAAPIVLIALRLVQGLALGGEYGGAAIYVAEHAPKNKRGFYTSWIQTTATLGLFMALLLILGIRTWMGEESFGDWGWRIPFLLSGILLGVSIWIRLSLNESPVFQRMKDEGTTSKRPLSESFAEWSNAKIAILALFGATAGEAVVWYGGQFYALFFLTQTIKVPAVTAQIMIVIALALGTPGFILFGWLSDKIGRKPIILAGFLLAALTYFPLYTALGKAADPANTNYPLAILIVAIMVSYVGMVYGPIGAFLAEYFPARIRYTSVSVPYHIGNGWGGGLVPIITTTAYLNSHGNLGSALLYPIIVPAVAFLLSLFLMPETRKISMWKPEEVGAARA